MMSKLAFTILSRILNMHHRQSNYPDKLEYKEDPSFSAFGRKRTNLIEKRWTKFYFSFFNFLKI